MTQHAESLAMPADARTRSAARRGEPVRQWLPVRTLDSQHRTQVRRHLQALSPQDRQLRFAHMATDEQIERYTDEIDFVHDEVFGVFDRRLRLVAMAHLAFAPDGLMAEFGVSVASRVRGRGFGTRLFDHAVMHARNRGVSTLILYVARDNEAMLSIVRRAGAQISFDGAEATARLPLLADTLGTRLEAMLEKHAAEFDYQLKLRVFRLDRSWEGGLSQPLPFS
ncbi:MAG: GNAT family N-acetyltransferase [Rubrivivax sp.]|nr:GNAT family N-acetyltransferase [Rubrivivax sp.]